MLICSLLQPLQCDQEEAHYSDGVEIQRHVLEAIDVIFPQYAGAHEHWNQTCDDNRHQCHIPRLCKILRLNAAKEAVTLFKKTKRTDSMLYPEDFVALPRSTLQKSMLTPFVLDQITSVFEGVNGDYSRGGVDDEEDEDDNEREREEL